MNLLALPPPFLCWVTVPEATLASALLSPQPRAQAPRTPRKLSRARKKDPLRLVSGDLASLLDARLLGWRGNGFTIIVIIVIIIIINYYFNSLAQEELGRWKVTWPRPSFVAFCDLWMEPKVSPPHPTLLPSCRYSCSPPPRRMVSPHRLTPPVTFHPFTVVLLLI